MDKGFIEPVFTSNVSFPSQAFKLYCVYLVRHDCNTCLFLVFASNCMFKVYYSGTPAQRKPERPVFQPRDRGEVFWNMTLLSIERTSLLLLHEYEYKVSDITMNNIGTATLRHPQFLYASSRTTRSSGKTSSSGTTKAVVNSTPQGLWLERLS